LVTGGTGFLGSRIVRLLCEAGHRVSAAGKPGDPCALEPGLVCRKIAFDLRDRAAIERAVRGQEAVFHTAALVSFDPRHYEAQMEINVEGTKILLNAAKRHGVKNFVYTSTVNTRGVPPPGRLGDEQTPFDWKPYRLGYMDSKHAAETLVCRQPQAVLRTVSVLCGTMFGPGDINFNAGTYIRLAARNLLWAAPPGGTTAAHVDDVAQTHLRALQNGEPGECYIAGGQPVYYKTLFAWIAEALNKRFSQRVIPAGPLRWAGRLAEMFENPLRPPHHLLPINRGTMRAATAALFYSSEKARKTLGARFRPARRSICDAVAWYRSQGLL
jgi:dihydroflavonol-4-reductase